MRRRLARLPVEAVIAAFMGSLGGAALVGAHGGDGALLHGCQQTGGTLRVVAATEECPGETTVDWRIQGAAGPRGDTGPAGATGATGSRGADGPPGQPGPKYRFRVVERVGVEPMDAEVRVACRDGERAVAGGMEGDRELRPLRSRPSADRGSWEIRALGGTHVVGVARWTLGGYAICAREVAP